MQWNFPTGSLAWSPHPAPHPNVSASAFWGGNSVLQGLPQNTPRWYHCTPLNPQQAARLTGGWPLPGADPGWTPGTWPPVTWGTSVPVQLAPCLIPNPANPNMPQIVWDISQNPVCAQRITGRHAIISLGSQFQQQATVPAAEEIHIAVQSAFVEHFWGPIQVTSKTTLTVWDILLCVSFFVVSCIRIDHNRVIYSAVFICTFKRRLHKRRWITCKLLMKITTIVSWRPVVHVAMSLQLCLVSSAYRD